MQGRTQMILRAFLRILPGLLFMVVLVGGFYTLLALVDHSWWKPLIVVAAGPLIGHLVSRARRRWLPGSADRAAVGDAVGHQRSGDK